MQTSAIATPIHHFHRTHIVKETQQLKSKVQLNKKKNPFQEPIKQTQTIDTLISKARIFKQTQMQHWIKRQ